MASISRPLRYGTSLSRPRYAAAGIMTVPVTASAPVFRCFSSGSVTDGVSGSVSGGVSGSVTDGVSGSVTDGVSGSVTGGVSGSVTGGVSGGVYGSSSIG